MIRWIGGTCGWDGGVDLGDFGDISWDLQNQPMLLKQNLIGSFIYIVLTMKSGGLN